MASFVGTKPVTLRIRSSKATWRVETRPEWTLLEVAQALERVHGLPLSSFTEPDPSPESEDLTGLPHHRFALDPSGAKALPDLAATLDSVGLRRDGDMLHVLGSVSEAPPRPDKVYISSTGNILAADTTPTNNNKAATPTALKGTVVSATASGNLSSSPSPSSSSLGGARDSPLPPSSSPSPVPNTNTNSGAAAPAPSGVSSSSPRVQELPPSSSLSTPPQSLLHPPYPPSLQGWDSPMGSGNGTDSPMGSGAWGLEEEDGVRPPDAFHRTRLLDDGEGEGQEHMTRGERRRRAQEEAEVLSQLRGMGITDERLLNEMLADAMAAFPREHHPRPTPTPPQAKPTPPSQYGDVMGRRRPPAPHPSSSSPQPSPQPSSPTPAAFSPSALLSSSLSSLSAFAQAARGGLVGATVAESKDSPSPPHNPQASQARRQTTQPRTSSPLTQALFGRSPSSSSSIAAPKRSSVGGSPSSLSFLGGTSASRQPPPTTSSTTTSTSSSTSATTRRTPTSSSSSSSVATGGATHTRRPSASGRTSPSSSSSSSSSAIGGVRSGGVGWNSSSNSNVSNPTTQPRSRTNSLTGGGTATASTASSRRASRDAITGAFPGLSTNAGSGAGSGVGRRPSLTSTAAPAPARRASRSMPGAEDEAVMKREEEDIDGDLAAVLAALELGTQGAGDDSDAAIARAIQAAMDEEASRQLAAQLHGTASPPRPSVQQPQQQEAASQQQALALGQGARRGSQEELEEENLRRAIERSLAET